MFIMLINDVNNLFNAEDDHVPFFRFLELTIKSLLVPCLFYKGKIQKNGEKVIFLISDKDVRVISMRFKTTIKTQIKITISLQEQLCHTFEILRKSTS